MTDNTLITVNDLSGFAHLVDGGRIGGQHIGYAQSGAADWISFQLANALVSNPLNSPAIEIMLGNLAFVADTELRLAIACILKSSSQQLVCRIDGEIFSANQSITVRKGQYVEIRPKVAMNYIYVAIAAKLDAPTHLESVCTVSREQSVQHNNMLSVGKSITGHVIDRPPILAPIKDAAKQIATLQDYVDMESDALFFHYCYQHSDFSFMQKHRFQNATYQIGKEAGKMGIKLEGPLIETERRALLSEGICLGAIQISAKGQPMVLLNDRQTIGGYPKIGVLGSVDCAKIAQKGINHSVVFQSTDVDALRTRRLFTDRLINAVKGII